MTGRVSPNPSVLHGGKGACEESEPYGSSPRALLGSLYSVLRSSLCGGRYLSIFLLLCPNPRRVEGALSSALNTWYYGVNGCFRCQQNRGCTGGLEGLRAGGRGGASAVGLPLLVMASPECWVTEFCMGRCWTGSSGRECGHSRHSFEARKVSPSTLP